MSCAKQTVIAIVKNNEKFWVGTNSCDEPQYKCPRNNMKSGEGYHLCKAICRQKYHAEVDACLKAGNSARGADLYLIGHSYCCDDCKAFMKRYGIKKVYFVNCMEEI